MLVGGGYTRVGLIPWFMVYSNVYTRTIILDQSCGRRKNDARTKRKHEFE